MRDEKKLTAVEWLADALPTIDWSDPLYRDKLARAKQMEFRDNLQARRGRVAITLRLAYKLLGEIEMLIEEVEYSRGGKRMAHEIAEEGRMADCYYELQGLVSKSLNGGQRDA